MISGTEELTVRSLHLRMSWAEVTQVGLRLRLGGRWEGGRSSHPTSWRHILGIR